MDSVCWSVTAQVKWVFPNITFLKRLFCKKKNKKWGRLGQGYPVGNLDNAPPSIIYRSCMDWCPVNLTSGYGREQHVLDQYTRVNSIASALCKMKECDCTTHVYCLYTVFDIQHPMLKIHAQPLLKNCNKLTIVTLSHVHMYRSGIIASLVWVQDIDDD